MREIQLSEKYTPNFNDSCVRTLVATTINKGLRFAKLRSSVYKFQVVVFLTPQLFSSLPILAPSARVDINSDYTFTRDKTTITRMVRCVRIRLVSCVLCEFSKGEI